MSIKGLLIIAVMVTVFAGCTPKTTNIDIINDEGKAVTGLDYRDFDQAASSMIQSLLASGTLQKSGGGRYVVTTGRIVNDTMQRIDTDQLMAKIEEDLMNSGQVVMTSAVGGQGASDKMIYEMRDIRDSAQGDEFQQETLAGKKTLVAPELSMAGKILQRNIKVDKNIQQVEYYFQLQLTDLTSGLRFWQKESIIGKRGSKKNASW